jgi:hypothetical protein
MHICTRSILRYRLEIVRKGKVIGKTKWRSNMMTDAGIDNMFNNSQGVLAACAYPIIGKGLTPTPVRHDSGLVTFTQAANTLTASSAFFDPADVGRLFKWGVGSAGVEVYISAYTDAQNVTVTGAPAIVGATAGTIWYVNTQTLQDPLTAVTWTNLNNALENNSVANVVGSSCTVTHTKTWYSSQMTANRTISEIAFNSVYYDASSVFDRDVVTPTVALLTGDQAKVVLQLILNFAPVTPLAVGNIATGYDSSGTFQIESLGWDYPCNVIKLNSSGNPGGSGDLEPGIIPYMRMYGSVFTQQAFNLGTNPNEGLIANKDDADTNTVIAYGSGNKYRDYKSTFGISKANWTNYGIGVGNFGYGVRACSQLFTTPFVKTSSQALEFVMRKSFQRILTN